MTPTLATRPFEAAFWILQFLGWAAFGIYKWIVAPHTRGETLVAIVIGFVITAGLRSLYKRLLAKSFPYLKIVAIACGCSVFAGLLWPIIVESLFLIFHSESLHAGMWLHAMKATLKFPLLSNRVFVFLVWSALFFGVTSWRDLQKQKARALQATILAQEAHLAMLRYQLNPHFLFNALNSIRALIEVDAGGARNMVTALAEFLRYSLLNASASSVALREEMEAIRNYLAIEKIRFGNRLEAVFDIAPAAETYQLPSFLLHPLIENALKYGMQTSASPLKIGLAAQVRNGTLHLEVSNTGSWVSPSENGNDIPSANGIGIGLQNVRQRLQQLFPGKSRFEIRASEGWVRAIIEIEQNGVYAHEPSNPRRSGG